MKINLLSAGAFIVALAMPLGVYAQQGQAPGGRGHAKATPSEAQLSHRWQKRLSPLNLSGDQQQRIQSMIDQYSQQHPQGSPRDRNASRELRRQIMSVLSSDQQNQYRAEMRQRHSHKHNRGSYDQSQGNPQYQGGQGPYQGGQQPYQGQEQPDQGPPDQGPPQGQGPPPGNGPPA